MRFELMISRLLSERLGQLGQGKLLKPEVRPVKDLLHAILPNLLIYITDQSFPPIQNFMHE